MAAFRLRRQPPPRRSLFREIARATLNAETQRKDMERRGSVLECAGALALSERGRRWRQDGYRSHAFTQSAAAAAHSKTLTRRATSSVQFAGKSPIDPRLPI